MVLASAAHASYTYNAHWTFDFGSSPTVNVWGGGKSGDPEYAGEIDAKRTGTGTGLSGDDNIPDNWLGATGTSIGAYCAELNQNIYIPGDYQYNVEVLNGSGTQSTVGSLPGVTFDFGRTLRLEKLWGGSFTPTDKLSAAAFQLAQWNILFDDNSDNSVTTGTFYASNLTGGDVTAAANTILGQVDSQTSLATVFLLSSQSSQDQIWGTTNPGGPPPGTTPEPFTMSLGLASAGLFIRRRLKAKKA